MTGRLYRIREDLTIPEAASVRYAELALNELNRHNGWGRCIGGDRGDLFFDGYRVKGNTTILYNPALRTTIVDLSSDEAFEIASEILAASFESIGVECVEHS